jgi:hypothetical protein
MRRDALLPTRLAVSLALATSALVLSACGAPATKGPTGDSTPAPTTTTPTTTPEPQQASVGSDGATLMLEGVGQVIIPPAALTDTVEATMSVETPPLAPPPTPVSEILTLTPHGTQFAVPAQIALHFQSDAPTASLHVMRLSDPTDPTWEPVGGVSFSDGVANFESTTFSYYAVVQGVTCKPQPAKTTSSCGKCAAGTFCSSAGTCVALATSKLCENKSLYVINGQLPADLVWIDEKQTTDPASAQLIATTLASACSQTPTTVSQATTGILDPCNDAPLLGEGTTFLLVGGSFGQRLARYLDGGPAPITSSYNDTTKTFNFVNRGGQTVASSPITLNESHDLFTVQLVKDPLRGALVIYVAGLGWEGTPAATWYFNNVLYPQIAAGTRTWQEYIVVEWADDGDGIKNAGDTFKVLASK